MSHLLVIGRVLQLTIAAADLAERAEVVSLAEQHREHELPGFVQRFAFRIDHHAIVDRQRAGGHWHAHTLYLDQALAAAAVGRQGFVVTQDFLATAVAALTEPGVGLVSSPYRAGAARTLGAVLEALTISADFIPSVAAARTVEGIRFALGAAMALTRQALETMGGFAALADFLADDYQLGWQVHQAGFKVRLLPYVVETVNPRMTFTDYFSHQLRWTRTYRVCRPGGYLAYGITHALVFSLALSLAAGWAPYALGLLAATLAVRLALAFFSERLCLQGSLPAAAFLLLPLKDLLSFTLWLQSFLDHRVTWQGAPFRLTPEGKLVAEGEQ